MVRGESETEVSARNGDAGRSGMELSECITRIGACRRRKYFKKIARDGCIPESFVGNYAVIYEPGAHFPAMTSRPLRVSGSFQGGLR